jgi:hypothetical protein
MKVRVQLKDLNEALNRVSVVKPLSVDHEKAYLFTTQDDQMLVHSQDRFHYSRVSIPCEMVDGEGAMMFSWPADRVEALKHLNGWIEIEPGKDGDRHWVKYRTEEGVTADRSSHDPDFYKSAFTSIKRSAQDTDYVFSTVLLREALSQVADYLAPDGTDESNPLRVAQLFDSARPEYASGNGTFFAADGQRVCHFHSPSLKDKGFGVHAHHVPMLISYLSKCSPTVRVQVEERMCFAKDQVPGSSEIKSVFGWTKHVQEHSRYGYPPDEYAKFILRVPRDQIVRALRQMIAEFGDRPQDKVRITYEDSKLLFRCSLDSDVVTSMPVETDPVRQADKPVFSANINIRSFLALFDKSKSHLVELRALLIPSKAAATAGGEEKKSSTRLAFCTVDEYHLTESGKLVVPTEGQEGAHLCQVSRFTTSMT